MRHEPAYRAAAMADRATSHRLGPPRGIGRDVLAGAAAGLVAMAAAAVADRMLEPLVSAEHKRRDRRVREGSPHAVAGPRFARKMLGREPTARGAAVARGIFSATYGLVWGVAYGLVRRAAPAAGRLFGLPFAVPFFVLCDGAIAPLLGLTPGLKRVPWQMSAKELGNHVAWTAGAEVVLRAAERVRRP